MRKRILTPISLLLITSACIGSSQKPICDCNAEAANAVRLINEYHFTDNLIYADSALIVLNQVIDHCPQWETNMMLRKALLFNDLAKYKDAINTTSSLEDADLPTFYNKTIITNKIKANEALSKNDTAAYRSYVGKIVVEYDRMLNSKRNQVDSILTSKSYDAIMNSDLTPLVELYYYHKSKLNGNEQVIAEINKLEKNIDGNQEYFKQLRAYFQENNNIHMSILFE